MTSVAQSAASHYGSSSTTSTSEYYDGPMARPNNNSTSGPYRSGYKTVKQPWDL